MVNLSVKGGVSGIEVDYIIIKDLCKKYNMDSLDTLQLIRYMANKAFGKDDE